MGIDTHDWYAKLYDRYGEDFIEKAGYFTETRPFETSYSDIFDLPEGKCVLQYSGAFFPFHAGHLECIKTAIDNLNTKWKDILHVVIHLDHDEYLRTKLHTNAHYDYFLRHQSFHILNQLNVPYTVIDENQMPNGCSRNFTRLFEELYDLNERVAFVCGGDRANYALSFIDKGFTFVAGRDQSEMYKKYEYLGNYDHRGSRFCSFYTGNNATSSTEIRNNASE